MNPSLAEFDLPSLISALHAFLPAAAVLHSPEERRPYECDGLTAYRRLPGVVVLPETVEQVQQVLRLCQDRRIPVVARGAGTGLSGGALPLAEGVLLSLAKFNRILDIDPLNRTARVQPGVRKLAISQAAATHGLYYARDPSSQIACSIGGNVAENAGGVHCLKYGLTVHNVLQLTVLTMGGELLQIGGASLDTPGYDLLALLHGSEGMLGVILEVTVKLLPLPERAQVVLAAFDDVGKAGALGTLGVILEASLKVLPRPALVGLCLRRHTFVYTPVRHRHGPACRASQTRRRTHRRCSRLLEQRARTSAWLLQQRSAALAAVRAACRRGERDAVFQPLAAPLLAVQQRLKQCFDPHGILNPGRLYAEL
jgi:FAD/FMN-containing dehydrogenase